MNILISESTTAMGGQELAVLLHAEGLQKRGHRVRLILEPGSPIHRLAEQKGLSVYPVAMARVKYPSAILSFRRLLLTERPDILHVNSSRDSWIGGIASRLVPSRPGVVRTRHISTPLNKSVTTRFLYQRLMDSVIVTGDETTRRAMIDRDGLAPDRVDAFPIGIDTTVFYPGKPSRDFRAELGVPPTTLIVGMVSFLRSYKGHPYVIEAAKHILSTRNDVLFVIVGEGPDKDAIQALIDAQGVGDRVKLLGFRDDLLNILHSLDVFVSPSTEGDTIPQAVMQALAVGLPVVSTTVGSIPDVVRDGVTGFVVSPRESRPLAERISQLLENEYLRRRFGNNAQAIVKKEYSLDAMLGRLEAVYQRVASRQVL